MTPRMRLKYRGGGWRHRVIASARRAQLHVAGAWPQPDWAKASIPQWARIPGVVGAIGSRQHLKRSSRPRSPMLGVPEVPRGTPKGSFLYRDSLCQFGHEKSHQRVVGGREAGFARRSAVLGEPPGRRPLRPSPGRTQSAHPRRADSLDPMDRTRAYPGLRPAPAPGVCP
jgi:hypothetical protein